MDRRDFSKVVALGASSLANWPDALAAAGDPVPNRQDAPQGAAGNPAIVPLPNTPGAEPVTVADFQALAKAALPQATYDYITDGSTDQITLRENTAAFSRIRLLPPLLTGVESVDTTTTVFKEKIAMPILLAPVGGQSIFHRQGALGAARAAAAAGTIYGLSTSAGHSVEEIAAVHKGPKWFQLYVPKDRGLARRLVERVEQAEFQAIVVTVDLGERKDADIRNRFQLSKEMLLKNLRDVGFEFPDRISNEELQKVNLGLWDFGLSWKLFDWLRPLTKLPILLKGVLRPEDAKRAVDLGLQGIVVSNHGGRRLDGVPATIEQLPKVVEAVAGRAEVFLDSGVRRGTDVLKALALGARAVLIGRPYAWALAAGGEPAVKRLLDLLKEELVSAMQACGCATVSEINKSLLA